MDDLERLRVRLLAEKHYRRTRRDGGRLVRAMQGVASAVLAAIWEAVHRLHH